MIAYVGITVLSMYGITGDLQKEFIRMGIPYAEKVLTAMQFAAYMLTGLFTAMGIF